jgi:hypothetical protein
LWIRLPFLSFLLVIAHAHPHSSCFEKERGKEHPSKINRMQKIQFLTCKLYFFWVSLCGERRGVLPTPSNTIKNWMNCGEGRDTCWPPQFRETCLGGSWGMRMGMGMREDDEKGLKWRRKPLKYEGHQQVQKWAEERKHYVKQCVINMNYYDYLPFLLWATRNKINILPFFFSFSIPNLFFSH